MSDNQIVPISLYASAIQYISPGDDYIDNQSVANEIKRAWDESCVVDKFGHIWLTDSCLNSILRTSKDNAKYYVQQIRKEHKSKDGDVTYIRGSEIIRFIDERLQNAGEIKKEKNLRFSYEMYSAIRDSDSARLLRAEYFESVKNCAKKLKKIRINQFNITQDELTGEILKKRTSEFSHIRSCSVYPYLMDNIINGHIVNKETHELITANSINDENELYNLCEEMGWNTAWYNDYVNYFGYI